MLSITRGWATLPHSPGCSSLLSLPSRRSSSWCREGGSHMIKSNLVQAEQTQTGQTPAFARSRSARKSGGVRALALRVLLHLVLIALSLIMLFPFLWTISAALKGDDA